jgi:hypothetical protein
MPRDLSRSPNRDDNQIWLLDSAEADRMSVTVAPVCGFLATLSPHTAYWKPHLLIPCEPDYAKASASSYLILVTP